MILKIFISHLSTSLSNTQHVQNMVRLSAYTYTYLVERMERERFQSRTTCSIFRTRLKIPSRTSYILYYFCCGSGKCKLVAQPSSYIKNVKRTIHELHVVQRQCGRKSHLCHVRVHIYFILFGYIFFSCQALQAENNKFFSKSIAVYSAR